MKKSSSGWFKLLAQQEGEFYNVPIVEDEEVAKLSAELEVRWTQLACLLVRSKRKSFLKRKISVESV